MIPPLHNIDLKALRVFCQIVESGGFTAAQLQLNASQPVMSNQIRQLEERLQMRLCERGRKGFSLTEEGMVVYQAALELFSSIENFRTVVSRDTSELKGELRISIMDNTATNPDMKIFEAISRIRSKAPNVDISLSIDTTVGLETGVVDGSRDLAIGYFRHRVPSLNYLHLFKEKHLLYCSARHTAAITDKNQLRSEITSFEFVDATYIDGVTETECENWLPVSTSPNIEALAILILSGSYIGYLPVHYATQWVEKGDLVPLLPETFMRSYDYYLITSSSRPRRLVASVFIEELKASLEI
ncbi:LysR family transcriptional regulator [Pseudomonas sp. BGr12]|uniref:LysR family transcriptional regulator n=1 Tax=Pseudomonas sp. BGr12 TaxID=2936269 RepID=UPI002559AC44|nr:LysR family transcriptional regulator [Pseudomonas sp. BJa5]MDL2428438.1 LysR family transcriptional regulator [Pseudomonas sp. BJa5]